MPGTSARGAEAVQRYSTSMGTKQIYLAMADDERFALDNIWRVSAKSSGFYLDTFDRRGRGLHLSLHGPTASHERHRFHIKPDPEMIDYARERGHVVQHSVPRSGQAFDGVQISDEAFLSPASGGRGTSRGPGFGVRLYRDKKHNQLSMGVRGSC